ncbi:hypothetical protein TW85_11205 [Marinomonas sp. S3726]|uniref:hypothetical protein n=1 Tax=Marinomonas sp. S3726 TaxID=579484 RepID=UPI0005F9E1FF|nr:hypothetical protein [Marinomonas sp. S3726]KJZ13763.1 hypothetical protein TW85_11205 [Marinomonas sp. S3726]
MLSFNYRLKSRCFSAILTTLMASLCITANSASLANQGLSESIDHYSSINYQVRNSAQRQLTYAKPGTQTTILTLLESKNSLQLKQGIKAFQPLFQSVQKQQNYQNLKKAFIDQNGVERQADLTNELNELDQEVSALSTQVNNEKDVNKKAKLNSELGKLKQEQRNLEKAIKGIKRKQNSLTSLPVYDLSQVFAHAYKKNFFLVDSESLYLVNVKVTRARYQDSLSGKSLSVNELDYRIDSQITLASPNKFSRQDRSVLKLTYHQDTLMHFSYRQQEGVLSHLEDAALSEFARLLKSTPLEPKELSFKGETLTNLYLWSNADQEKTLEVSYKETGKRKNLIQVKVSAQTNVFDPKQSSTALEKHIGVLAVAKGQRLVELKKIQTINGKKDIGWDQDIRNGIIKLGPETIFVSKEDYYGYEGLWYLASWMSRNNIKLKRIFLINGTEPISLTAKLTKAGEVEISKAGNALYQFSVDSNGFVTNLFFTPSKQMLTLVSKETKSTKANKAKIKQYMQNNKIILL